MRWLLFALLLCGAPRLVAAERREAVRFEPGKSSAAVAGKLQGRESVTHTVEVRSGQAVAVHFTPNNSSCLMNVWAPGDDAATHIGSINGNDYTTELARGGSYGIQVYLMRNAARRDERCEYQLTVELGAGGKAAVAETATSSRDVLGAAVDRCLETMGAPADVIDTLVVKPGVWTLHLRERGSSRNASCTVTRDGRIEGWAER